MTPICQLFQIAFGVIVFLLLLHMELIMLNGAEFLALEEAVRKETKSLDRLSKEKPLYKAVADGQKDVLQKALVKIKEGFHEAASGSKK